MRDHATTVLILDDITRLKMHREADQDALDLLRSLMSMNITLILVGVDIPQSGLLRTAWSASSSSAAPPRRGGHLAHQRALATQTDRRFDLVSLDPFNYDTPEDINAWVAHLAGIEDQLRLFRASPPGC